MLRPDPLVGLILGNFDSVRRQITDARCKKQRDKSITAPQPFFVGIGRSDCSGGLNGFGRHVHAAQKRLNIEPILRREFASGQLRAAGIRATSCVISTRRGERRCVEFPFGLSGNRQLDRYFSLDRRVALNRQCATVQLSEPPGNCQSKPKALLFLHFPIKLHVGSYLRYVLG